MIITTIIMKMKMIIIMIIITIIVIRILIIVIIECPLMARIIKDFHSRQLQPEHTQHNS